jgi:small ligand-binding sensory domain FIST
LIRAATAISTEPDSARAALAVASEVSAQLAGADADWCIAFATPDHAAHLSTLQHTLAGATGTPYVVGCSASGVMTAQREVEKGPALGVLAVTSDQMRGTPFLFQDEGDRGMSAGVRLGQRMLGSRESDDLLLVWPDAFHVRPDRLLQSLDAVLGNVPVIGGAASGRAADAATFQFCGSENHANAVSGIRLAGDFRHKVGVTQGCRPLGPPIKVTRAHENLILELDGRPALDLLRDRAPAGMLDDIEWAFNFLFVGLLPDPQTPEYPSGEYLVRNIVDADPEAGVIGVSEQVQEGQYIHFVRREAGAAREDMTQLLRRLSPKNTGQDYRFGLYFNCLARGSSLYNEPGIDSALIREALPDVPVLGFSCNAEIGPMRGVNQLFTYTGVLALFGE